MRNCFDHPAVNPVYVEGQSQKKFSVTTPALVYGCGNLIHEKIFLRFVGDDITLYDPDIFKTVHDPLKIGKKQCSVYRNWGDITKQKKQFKSIVCFFSLHYIPNWIDRLWELHQLLEIGGYFYFAEDKGFRALLDNSYNPTSRLVDPVVFEKIWGMHVHRKEAGAPWYPDISAGNINQVREILAPYYDYNSDSDLLERLLVRKVSENEILNHYLPWMATKWDLGDLRFSDKTPCFSDMKVKDLLAIGTSDVKEKVLVYRLQKVSDSWKSPWDFLHDDFRSHVWAIKLSHCYRSLVRNTLEFSSDKVEGVVTDLFRSYLTVIYQHLLRHLPTGTMEFVSVFPKYFLNFRDSRYEAGQYLSGLPVISWGWGDKRGELGIVSDGLGMPQWYQDYTRKLDNEEMKWMGEQFLVKNHGSFTYFWKYSKKGKGYKELEKYYCSHFYDTNYCAMYGYEVNPDPDWAKRDLPPTIYMTVAASRKPGKVEGQSVVIQVDSGYVGTVLYGDKGSEECEPDRQEKYLLIGSLLSHLTAYVQAQATTAYAVFGLKRPIKLEIERIYHDAGVDLDAIDEIYGCVFPATEAAGSKFRKQHNISAVTESHTNHNIQALESIQQGALKKLTKLPCTGLLSAPVENALQAKRLKAVLSRSKGSIYLFDLYEAIKQLNGITKSWGDVREKDISEERDKIDGIATGAFWRILGLIRAFIALGDVNCLYYNGSAIAIISPCDKYPSPLEAKTPSLSGSFGDYVNLLCAVHNEVFGLDHKFFSIRIPDNDSYNGDNILDGLVQIVGHPAPGQTGTIAHLSHLYIANVKSGGKLYNCNGLLLRKFRAPHERHP